MLTRSRIQTESFGIRSPETVDGLCKYTEQARNGSAQLRTLVDSFVYGRTVQTVADDDNRLRAFTSGNIANREIGQKIASKLKKKTQEAIIKKSVSEHLLSWKIRSSIEWLSKSSYDLSEWKSENALALSFNTIPVSDKARRDIATTFLDALKSAWLLLDTGDLQNYEQPSFEIKQVVVCSMGRNLDLFKSFFKDIFTVPDYKMIYERGDFSIDLIDDRTGKARRPRRSGYGSDSLQSISHPGLPTINGDQALLPKDLEGSVSPPLSPTKLSTAVPDVELGQGNHNNSESIDVNQSSTSLDGLHITHIEIPSTQASSPLPPAITHEVELLNAETLSSAEAWTGFHHNVSSVDRSSPHDAIYSESRVHLFKSTSEDSNYLRLITYRSAYPVDSRIIQPSSAQLVPLYAFTDDRSRSSELYISDSGMQTSLQYRFQCQTNNEEYNPWELYGFQGALMGANFEGDYSPASVVLHRCGSSRSDIERFPRIQMWTDFPYAHQGTSNSSPTSSPSTCSPSSPLSSIYSRDFFALTSHPANGVNDSKIFVFSRHFIYIFFGWSRNPLSQHSQFADTAHS